MQAEATREAIREVVRQAYGAIATGQTSSGCCGSGASCCGPAVSSSSEASAASSPSRALGYSDEDLGAVPEGADLGLGCGNPQAIAALRPGERVLDLGSGAGFDAFLAARQVGPGGRVLGVDMTAAMVAKARANAIKAGVTNVEFRLGEIERLPVSDASVDVIMSNCVINLSPDKPAVFAEAFRVLAPGGRLAISDVVALAPLPESLAADVAAYAGCIAGAAVVSDLRRMLTDAGFADVRIDIKEGSRAIVSGWLPGSGAEDYVASASIEAVKAAAACCDSTLLSSCCQPEQKSQCCGEAAAVQAAPASCGCGQPAVRS